jgi:hypothetical protein
MENNLENLIEQRLSEMPKNAVPLFDTPRVRKQIIHRISLIKPVPHSKWFTAFSPYIRISAGVVASFFILVSLSLATVVTALDSVPGSAIYPLKKVVENIQLKLASKDQKTELQLKFANNRIDELEQVLEARQEGKISDEEAGTIIASTVKDFQKTAAAAANSTKAQSKPTNIVNKLASLSNKLLAATIQSEGQVKIELEKALESTKISQEEAIKNLEQAGLKVEKPPLTIDDLITASGKLTEVTADSVSIGTAKFLMTEDTIFTNLNPEDLKTGLVVDIAGKIEDNKAYAQQIKLIGETKETETETNDTPVEDDRLEE